MNAKENEKISEGSIDTSAEENKGDKKTEKNEVRTLSCLFFHVIVFRGVEDYISSQKSLLWNIRA